MIAKLTPVAETSYNRELTAVNSQKLGQKQNTVDVTNTYNDVQLPDQTDQIEWTCMGTDDKVIDGIRESGNQTRFAIGKITQSYVIQRADQTSFGIVIKDNL